MKLSKIVAIASVLFGIAFFALAIFLGLIFSSLFGLTLTDGQRVLGAYAGLSSLVFGVAAAAVNSFDRPVEVHSLEISAMNDLRKSFVYHNH